MKNFIRTLSVISVLTLFSTMVSADINDGDVKIYPGSICTAYHGSDIGRISFSDGAIYANSTGLSISCPLVRDEPDSSKLYISIWGTKADNLVTCTLRDTSYGGGNITYYQSNTVTNSGNFYLSISVPSTYAYGSYSMYCMLPAAAKIKQIHVTEVYK